MSITWVIVAILFLVAEVTTVNLITLWFFLGAVVVIIAELLGLSHPLGQSVLFLSSSLLSLVFFYPWAKKRFKPNTDGVSAHLIGHNAVVIEPISLNKGAVEIAGQVWSVKRVQGSTVPQVGDKIRIVALEGIKVVIEALPVEQNI